MTDTHEQTGSASLDVARKHFTAAYNLAGWDGDWESAAYAATQLIAALEAALTAEQATRERAEGQVDAAYKKGYDDAREDFQGDAEHRRGR